MTRMRAPERRRQLLEVAATLFAERGYRGTTTADLAAAAGVTEPILYRHFTSKLDLFTTLVDVVGDAVIDAWEAMLAEVTDPHERFRILLHGNPATDPRGRDAYRVVFRAMNEHAREPDIARAIRDHVARLHAFIRDEVSSLRGTGVVRSDIEPDAVAWLLVSAGIGVGMVLPLGGDQRPGLDDDEMPVVLARLLAE